MGCCVCHERPNREVEGRDVSQCPYAAHNDWVERMLHDIGTDLPAVARDFPRMVIFTKKNTDRGGKRADRVLETLKAIIAIAEDGNPHMGGSAHYYALKAAVLDSPMNIASTAAETETESSLPNVVRSMSVNAEVSPPPDSADNSTTDESNTLELTHDNLAKLPHAEKVLAEITVDREGHFVSDGETRGRKRVTRVIDKFVKEWGAAADIGADLSGHLLHVFESSGLCKRVQLTTQQHRRMLDAKFRQVVEDAANAPSLESSGQVTVRREKEVRSRLGLVGSLEYNAEQKQRKEANTAKLQALIHERGLDVGDDDTAEGANSNEFENGSIYQSSINTLDEAVTPVKRPTRVPQKRSPQVGFSSSRTSPAMRPVVISPHSLVEDNSDDGEAGEGQLLLASTKNASSPNHGATDCAQVTFLPEPDTPPRNPGALSKDASSRNSSNAGSGILHETYIANCRTMEVLFYFAQGVMFYPSQRMHFLLWFPWISRLVDVAWVSRIHCNDTETFGDYLTSIGSPKGHAEPATTTGGLIHITHRMTNRNYVSKDDLGEVPEFEVEWSLEVVLFKNFGAISEASAQEIRFVDAKIILHEFRIKKRSGFCTGKNKELYEMRRFLLSSHVFDTFEIEATEVENFQETTHIIDL